MNSIPSLNSVTTCFEIKLGCNIESVFDEKIEFYIYSIKIWETDKKFWCDESQAEGHISQNVAYEIGYIENLLDVSKIFDF